MYCLSLIVSDYPSKLSHDRLDPQQVADAQSHVSPSLFLFARQLSHRVLTQRLAHRSFNSLLWRRSTLPPLHLTCGATRVTCSRRSLSACRRACSLPYLSSSHASSSAAATRARTSDQELASNPNRPLHAPAAAALDRPSGASRTRYSSTAKKRSRSYQPYCTLRECCQRINAVSQ